MEDASEKTQSSERDSDKHESDACEFGSFSPFQYADSIEQLETL